MQLVVGRIGRPHGIRGEVAVQVRTDHPDRRFAAGSVLATEPAALGPLTVLSTRWHSGRLLVTFAGPADRSDAESLTGTLLVVDSAEVGPPDDPDEFNDHDLIGLDVLTTSGDLVGTVKDVLHHGQDLLVVRQTAGHERDDALVPFVTAIVPDVDIAAGRLIIDPPPGLLGPDPGSQDSGGQDSGDQASGGQDDVSQDAARRDADRRDTRGESGPARTRNGS
jgi:16S rRNA processing protein RimM